MILDEISLQKLQIIAVVPVIHCLTYKNCKNIRVEKQVTIIILYFLTGFRHESHHKTITEIPICLLSCINIMFVNLQIFPILPLTIELLTKGISLWNTRNEDSMLRKYLPFAIYGALIFGFIASLMYTGAALTVTIK